MASALVTRRASNKTMDEEKWRRCWRQDSRYLCFVYLIATTQIFSGVFFTYATTYIFKNCMYRIQSVTRAHNSQVRRLPFCSEPITTPSRLLVGFDLTRNVLLLHKETPALMMGL